jgi:acyl carrier protein
MPDMTEECTAQDTLTDVRDTVTDEIATTVLTVFQDVLGCPAPRGLDTCPADVEEWDSLGHIHLAHAIEHRLGRQLPEEHLVATPDTTLRSLIEAL